MKLSLDLPRDALASLRGDLSRTLAEAVTGLMKDVTDGLKADLRAQTVAAGLGSRMGNTWRSRVYAGSDGVSLSPAGVVWTKAPGPMRAFAEGATIRGKGGGWLAIPTGAVAGMKGFHRSNIFPKAGGGLEGVGARKSRITPRAFIAQTGLKLQFVFLGRARALLVATGVSGGKSRRLPVRAKTMREAARGRADTVSFVAFVLVPQARINKRLDVPGAVARAGARLRGGLPAAIERAAVAAARKQERVAA